MKHWPNFMEANGPSLIRSRGIVKSSSGESITSASAAATHPYRLAAPLALPLTAVPPHPVHPAHPSPADYPLRKTGTFLT